MKKYIQQIDLKFWLTFIGIIVAGAISFTVLKMKVMALEEKYVICNTVSIENNKILRELQITVAKVQKDIDYLKNTK